MSYLDVPVITQEEYEKLDGESDILKSGKNIGGLIYINDILDKFLIRNRKCAWFSRYDKYDFYLEYNDVYRYVTLGSFNMNYFIKEKKEKPLYLKVNFSFPKLNIKTFKGKLNEPYVNTKDFIPVIVNPKLFSNPENQYFPNVERIILSTAFVYKTSEEDTYDHIKCINDFFEKATGEVLFFRF